MKINYRLTLAAVYGLTIQKASAIYQLDTTYDVSNFFSAFDFFSGPDPTHGFVEYVDYATAFRDGLVKYINGGIFMGVDHTTYSPVGGRRSVRLTSRKSFTQGLIIADISHMPSGACGVWPAFWMFGPDWPSSGEIDIIEGVNSQVSNTVTLHTSSGCLMTLSGGKNQSPALRKDCSSTSGGCGMQTMNTQNYGDGFNNIHGGLYATEWTAENISVWFFPRYSIPADLTSRTPDPQNWGDPLVRFTGGGGCNIDSHFKNNQIVFDTTFCGDWAGDPHVWNSNPRCSALGPSCRGYVANNPLDFSNAYWLVNSINVYQNVGISPLGGRPPSSTNPSFMAKLTTTSPPDGKGTLQPWPIQVQTSNTFVGPKTFDPVNPSHPTS